MYIMYTYMCIMYMYMYGHRLLGTYDMVGMIY